MGELARFVPEGMIRASAETGARTSVSAIGFVYSKQNCITKCIVWLNAEYFARFGFPAGTRLS